VHDARVVDRNGDYPDGDLSVRIDRRPNAFLFKKPVDFKLKARVCCNCGHTELYATDLDTLWQTARTALAGPDGTGVDP
jgi:hypothetical protein